MSIKLRNENIRFDISSYEYGGGLAIIMWCDDGPYATLTVNLEDEKTSGPNCQFVDTNNLGYLDIMNWIVDNNLGEETGHVGFSGYCMYPEVRFNLEEINKHL